MNGQLAAASQKTPVVSLDTIREFFVSITRLRERSKNFAM